MTQKKIYLSISLFLSCSVFFGCSDNKKESDEVVKVSETYGGNSGNVLALKYSDTELPGKKIEFSTSTGTNASITLHYIVPGEETTVLPSVTLKAVTGTRYDYQFEFEGSLTTSTGSTLKYEGRVTALDDKKEMAFNAHVTMPANGMLGMWTLDETSPVHLDWQSGQTIKVGIFQNKQLNISVPATFETEELNDLLRSLMGAYPLQALFNSVTFLEDGNIVVEYSKEGALGWTKSPLNLAHYYIAGENQLGVTINRGMLLNEMELTGNMNGSLRVSTEDITQMLDRLEGCWKKGYH